ncbi:hypothetical protein ACF0H5_017335 [Mactra antiquata]
MIKSLKFLSSCVVIIQVLHLVQSADQSLIYRVNEDTPDTVYTIQIFIYANDDTVGVVSFIDPDDGEPSCTYNLNDLSATSIFETVPTTGVDKDATAYAQFKVDASSGSPAITLVDGTSTGCVASVDPTNSNFFVVYLHAKGSAGASAAFDAANDMEYTIQTVSSSGRTRASSRRTGLVGPVTPTVTPISASSFGITLSVVDPNAGHATVTSLPLGSPAKLKVDFTVNSFVDGLDPKGAKCFSCYADDVSTFDSHNVAIVDANGCMTTNDLLSNQDTSSGFIVTSDTPVGGTLNFVAMTKSFEVSGFFVDDFTSVRPLHIKCKLGYCFTNACSGNQCSSNRKKREDEGIESHIVVTTSVNITRRVDSKCEKCSDSTTYVISTATLTALITIAFGLMSFAFLGARRIGKAQARKTGQSKQNNGTVPSLTKCLKNEAIATSDKNEEK